MLAISTFVLPLALALLSPEAAAGVEAPPSVKLAAKAKKEKPKADAAEAGTDTEAPPTDDVEQAEEAAPAREVKYGGAEVGQSIGGATGFVFKRGFYAQSDIGGFIRFGGFTDASPTCPRCKPVLTSNLQPYIGFSVGYDFLDWVGAQISFGEGFVANAAPFGTSVNGPPGSTESPRDYGITYINVGPTFSWYFYDRLALAVKAFGGAALLSPAPDVRNGVPVPFLGGDVGAGIGIRYATLLTDLVIGFDITAMSSFSDDGAGGVLVIPAMSFAPVIKYQF
jgi:hypothetical protein